MTTSHLYLHHLYDVLVGALHGKTQQQVWKHNRKDSFKHMENANMFTPIKGQWF